MVDSAARLDLHRWLLGRPKPAHSRPRSPFATHRLPVRGSEGLEWADRPPLRFGVITADQARDPKRSAFATTCSPSLLLLLWARYIDARQHLTCRIDWGSLGSTCLGNAPRSSCSMTDGRPVCTWPPERLRYRAATVACRRGDTETSRSPFIAALPATQDSLREPRIFRSEAGSLARQLHRLPSVRKDPGRARGPSFLAS